MALKSLFAEFDNIVVLDTETSGLDFKGDEIIELAALRLHKNDGDAPSEDMDDLILLSEGKTLTPFVTQLTGITDEQLKAEGVSKRTAAERLYRMLDHERTLAVAYNAQFDFCFLYYFLQREGMEDVLRRIKLFDALTVYKDRRPYPHKLFNAIEQYGVEGKNSHRALDDTYAALRVLMAMGEEQDDLINYVGLFGYSAKYGVSGPRISSVTYKPQGFSAEGKLYESSAK